VTFLCVQTEETTRILRIITTLLYICLNGSVILTDSSRPESNRLCTLSTHTHTPLLVGINPFLGLFRIQLHTYTNDLSRIYTPHARVINYNNSAATVSRRERKHKKLFKFKSSRIFQFSLSFSHNFQVRSKPCNCKIKRRF